MIRSAHSGVGTWHPIAVRAGALARRVLYDLSLTVTLMRHPLAYGRWCRREQRTALRARRRVWVIAAEVAQLHVALRFIHEVRNRHPDLGFVLSVPNRTTRYGVAGQLQHDKDVITYLPLPMIWLMWRALSVIRPLSIVLLLNNLSPTLAWLARRRGIPVAVIGAEAPVCRPGRTDTVPYPGSLLDLAIDGIQILCARTEQDRDAFIAAGFDPARMRVTGSPKFDAAGPARVPVDAIRRHIGIDASHLVLVGGSIAAGEDRVLLDIYVDLKRRFPMLALILAPRATQDAPAIVGEAEQRGLVPMLRSRLPGGDPAVPAGDPPVIVVDTLGELRSLYACATVVFVGRSLTGRSGSNLMEPAGHGKAIVVGPYVEDFEDELTTFLEADAVRQVADAAGLRAAVEELLSNPDLREGYGRRARGVVTQHAGALRRAVDYLDTQGWW